MGGWRDQTNPGNGIQAVSPISLPTEDTASWWARTPTWVKVIAGVLLTGSVPAGVTAMLPFETKENAAAEVVRLEAVDAGLQKQIDELKTEVPKATAAEVIKQLKAEKRLRGR